MIGERWERVGLLGSEEAKTGDCAYGSGEKLELSLTINRLAASGGLSRPVSFVPSSAPGPTLSTKTDA